MLDALYQDKILTLAKQARLRDPLAGPDGSARADNPLCGDRVTVDVKLTPDAEGKRIAALGHRVRGCALCEAAAEVIAIQAPGLDAAALTTTHNAMRDWLASGGGLGSGGEAAPPWESLGIFAPVCAIPARHECVLLPFKAASDALANAEAS